MTLKRHRFFCTYTAGGAAHQYWEIEDGIDIHAIDPLQDKELRAVIEEQGAEFFNFVSAMVVRARTGGNITGIQYRDVVELTNMVQVPRQAPVNGTDQLEPRPAVE